MWSGRGLLSPTLGLAFQLPHSACSAAKSFSDNFTALPALSRIVARKAAEKVPTAIVDHDEGLFAFVAGAGHGARLAR
jgi:hypothetical protein